MKLICPNCQKELTVPDQYAGQVMKCPLCAGNFTAPTLPQAPSAPEPGPSAAPPNTYGLAPEPITPVTAPSPAPAPPRKRELAPTPAPTTPAPQTPVSTDYQRRRSFTINARILPWIAVVCLGLVFFLQFFPWIGFYAAPGGDAIATQNAWGMAFGNSANPEYKDVFEKGFSGNFLMGFYALLFVILLLLAIGALIVGIMPVQVPPQVQKLVPWRWTLVGGLALLTFLFLVLQLLAGTSFESELADKIANHPGDLVPALQTASGQEAKRSTGIVQAALTNSIHRTNWLRLAVVLQLVAIVAAGLTSWIGHRVGQPVPRIDLQW